MPLMRTLTGGAFATTLLLAVASSPLTRPAHADLYHPVEPGDTLSAIAARYHLSSEAIRAANKLDNTRDTAPLPAMLLLIPDAPSNFLKSSAPKAEPKTETALPVLNGITSPTLMASATTVNAPSGSTNDLKSASGTIVQLTRYVVQNGDTIQSIAQKFSKPGAAVSASEIRRRNYISSEPAVGTMLLVPVASVNYSPISEVGLTTTAPEKDAREMLASLPSDGPRVIEQPNPVFQSPAGASSASSRRGNTLSSRGMSTDNSVLLVQPGQEAAATTQPSPRSRAVPTAQPQTALARVAKVAQHGRHDSSLARSRSCHSLPLRSGNRFGCHQAKRLMVGHSNE